MAMRKGNCVRHTACSTAHRAQAARLEWILCPREGGTGLRQHSSFPQTPTEAAEVGISSSVISKLK